MKNVRFWGCGAFCIFDLVMAEATLQVDPGLSKLFLFCAVCFGLALIAFYHLETDE